MDKIDFYFDFQSPFSYLAWRRWREGALSRSHLLVPRPVIMGKIIHAYDTKGPAEIAPKRNFLFKQCVRIAHSNNWEFALPKLIPFHSQPALRLVAALEDQADQLRLMDKLFMASWGEGKDISSTECLQQLAGEFFSDCEQVFLDKAVRKKIKNSINEALELGVFGVPTFAVKDEIFWGQDSILDLEAYIRGRDVVDQELYLDYCSRFTLGSAQM